MSNTAASQVTTRSKVSFEEFKLYFESAERVTDRRLETNRWNYTVCVAILIAIAIITNWSFSATNLVWLGLGAVLVLCLMAMLFCILWVGQIRAYKELNNAKFEVLNEMAPHLEFHPDQPGLVNSYEPFAKEWAKLNASNALEELKRSNIVALKSSNMEYFIPKAFVVLFGSIFVVLLVVVVVKWPPSRLARPPMSDTTSATVKQRANERR